MVLKGNCGRVRIVARGFCGGLLKTVEGVGPVSYTHLDVYKRQVLADR